MKKILHVDDHKLFLKGFKLYFNEVADWEITSKNVSKEIPELIRKEKYDLIVLDICMPDLDGFELAKIIKKEYPNQKIMFLSMMGEIEHLKSFQINKCEGYVLKDSDSEILEEGIRNVLKGRRYIDPVFTNILLEGLISNSKEMERLPIELPLTEREKEVMRLITREYTTYEIAEALFISVRTVEAHKRNLLNKLGLKNVAGLIVYAVEHNIK